MRAAMHSSVPYGLRTHAVCAEPNRGFDMSCQRMLTLAVLCFLYMYVHMCVFEFGIIYKAKAVHA